MDTVSAVIVAINHWVTLICSFLAIIVIFVGIVKALIVYVKSAFTTQDGTSVILMCRLELGLSFSLGLGFMIGSSILKTAIAPSWNDIGQLSAIIAIRTVLNFFLRREISSDMQAHNDGLKTEVTK